ncbi:hypothetical protein QQ020_24385 [Fulvivirgaceae bacterium BMA12]|uniref:Uncharacterized protein n=1 Tax=Agaribacillus aureus TaxID=3051825 RepID=A0ABT8LEP8_9BACT|nr:hypothetical protein [Fulvivirgaceae bacterium BMA12]
MSELPIFLKQLMAQKTLWAIIITGNFSEVKKSDLAYVFNTPISLEVNNLSLGDGLFFESVNLRKNPPDMPEFDSIEELNEYLVTLDCDLQNYEKITLSFHTLDPSYYTDPERFFGAGNVSSRYEFDPENRKFTDKVKYHVIEYPNFEVPMYISVSEFMLGKFSITATIPKSGKFKSRRPWLDYLNSIDPSKIEIHRND